MDLLWMYIFKTNTYPRNVKLTFLLLKCQFSQNKLSRSSWLFLAKFRAFLQLFSCQHSRASFTLAKFYIRRTEDVFKYAKPVYLCNWWFHFRTSHTVTSPMIKEETQPPKPRFIAHWRSAKKSMINREINRRLRLHSYCNRLRLNVIFGQCNWLR